MLRCVTDPVFLDGHVTKIQLDRRRRTQIPPAEVLSLPLSHELEDLGHCRLDVSVAHLGRILRQHHRPAVRKIEREGLTSMRRRRAELARLQRILYALEKQSPCAVSIRTRFAH